MQSGVRDGFFYRGLYFLLPEGYADAASFLTALRQSALPAAAEAIVLRERCDVEMPSSYELGVCIAPYFIADYLEAAETIVIEDAGDVYPVQVELLTQQEYNDRLRALVTEYCPGCRGFGGLTKSDSSLSGHFDEISLNGVCPYRWETRNSPRSFLVELNSFGHYWKRFGFASLNADDLMEEIKQALKLTYTSGAMMEGKGKRTLVLYAEKPTVLQTALTDVLSSYVSSVLEDDFVIRFNGRAVIDETSVSALLTPKKIAATRKEFKKYGAALAILEYQPECQTKIADYMEYLASEGLAHLLLSEPGKYTCLLTNAGHALNRLRYASPMLQECAAKVTVYDATKTAQYQINYDMPATVFSLAPVEAPKAKKTSKKQLKAEEGRILKRDQVKALFTYVDIRLADVGCDHTTRYTEIWLKENLPPEQYEAALEEIRSMNGLCDCEVLMNCYEDYDLED